MTASAAHVVDVLTAEGFHPFSATLSTLTAATSGRELDLDQIRTVLRKRYPLAGRGYLHAGMWPCAGPELLDEAAFEVRFVPRDAPDGGSLWQADQLGNVDLQAVWSQLEDEQGLLHVVPGPLPGYLASLTGYVVTAERWPHPVFMLPVHHDPCPADRTPQVLTVLPYMYRDGGNWKESGDIVLDGAASIDQLLQIRAALVGDEQFIPTQIGLPHLALDWPNFPGPDDHVWHELQLDGVSIFHSYVPVETHSSVEAFTEAMRAATGHWDDTVDPASLRR